MLNAAFSESSDAYLLEALRELHVPQIFAQIESLHFDGLQRRRSSYAFQPTFLEAVLPEVFQSIWELDRLQVLASRERAVLDFLQR